MRPPDKRYAKALIVSVYGAVLALTATAQKVPEPYPASTAHPPPAWFEDVAPQAGIKVLNVNGGVTSKRYILEATGSGVAILDYDNDGYPDIFLVNGAYLHSEAGETGQPPTSHLFHNNHDGTFTDVTAKSGLAETGWGQGACVGDYDNDGFPDLYVTGYGKNRLYHNEGHGRFREVAEQAGVAGTGKEWGTGCAFVDYDRDGKLDIAVANYVHFDIKDSARARQAPAACGRASRSCAVRAAWSGRPTRSITISATANSRMSPSRVASQKPTATTASPSPPSTADEDGWPDIYIACDSTPAILYRNNHDGTFTDRAADAGVAFNEDGREQAGMGSTVADYDGDGQLDIFKTNFSDDTATLYHAHGDGTFDDVTYTCRSRHQHRQARLGHHVRRHRQRRLARHPRPPTATSTPRSTPAISAPTTASPACSITTSATANFADITKDSGPGITTPASARGLAIADLWNDGRQEVVINDLSSTAHAARQSQLRTAITGLDLALTGTKSNRTAIGARVTVRGTAAGKERVWVNEVRSGSSYNSSSDLRLHFGLGPSPVLQEIEVSWPSGLKETFPAPPIDHITPLTEGAGKPLAAKAEK